MNIEELARRLTDVEAQLVLHAAHEHCRSVLYRYADACDANDAAAVATLFATDATLHARGEALSGRAAIREWYATSLGTPTRHFVTNITFGPLEHDVVAVRSALIAVVQPETGPILLWGHYADRIRLSAASNGALIVERTITIDDRKAL